MEDARTEGGLTYYRVDAEDLSLPVSALAEPTDSTLSWTPEPVTIASLAGLRAAAGDLLLPGIGGQPLCPVPGPLQGLRRRPLRRRRRTGQQRLPAGQGRDGRAGGCGPLDGDGHLLRRQLGL